jgi:small subunit ribosomal protein S2
MTEIIEEIEENIEKAGEEIEKVIGEVTEKKKAKKTTVKKKPKKSDEEKLAELESVETEAKDEEKSELEKKKKALLERAKKLAGKVEETSTEELKEQVKVKKREDTLVPIEDYVRSGIYIGKRVVTPDMRPFVYRRRADGLAIFNTDLIDEKLKEGIEFLSRFNAEDVILVCKREAGWKAAELFSRATGIRVFTKKYPAGVLTNAQLPDFFENELTVVTDSWLDKNAFSDTRKVNKQVLMICDTNNFAHGVKNIIIGNNKTQKSLGIIFYLLAKGYCKAKGIDANLPDMDIWMGDDEENEEAKKMSY